MDHGLQAAKLFTQDYNCAQAVVLAFGDLTGLEPKLAARLASPFGGGMGRMREVCGAVSGMFAVLGILYGYDETSDNAAKKALYADIQTLAARFRAQAGSIICREILKNPTSDPNPSPRTAEYYALRPCARMCYLAGSLLDDFIAEHPLEG